MFFVRNFFLRRKDYGLIEHAKVLDALIKIRNLPDPSTSRPLVDHWISDSIVGTRFELAVLNIWHAPWDSTNECPIGKQVWDRIVDIENHMRLTLKFLSERVDKRK